jgi:iron complex outermembrane receptor protein
MRDPCPSSCGWPTGSTCLPQRRRPSLFDGPGALSGSGHDRKYVPLESLTLRAGVETLNGHYTNFHNAPFNNPALDPAGRPIGGNVTSSGDATGFATVRSPKFTANVSASYRMPIAVGRLDLSMTYYYNDGFAWDPDNRLRQAHYNLLSASASWSSPRDVFGVRPMGQKSDRCTNVLV